jgi:precorrin-8X/cobalt-precorrin-8 methylmutase
VALADHWHDAVVVIGNAPTALLALLDALADGAPQPAALIATPCGLVAAAEAKQLLLDTTPCPAITVRGTRGGSAVAAAAVNACALLALSAAAPA